MQFIITNYWFWNVFSDTVLKIFKTLFSVFFAYWQDQFQIVFDTGIIKGNIRVLKWWDTTSANMEYVLTYKSEYKICLDIHKKLINLYIVGHKMRGY